jgi:DNA (cytosine-5)-methyltransferase 1
MNDSPKDGNSAQPAVIDLFCGVGGLTLGAARAGFEVVAAVDSDSRTERTFRANFPKYNYIGADISKLCGSDLRDRTVINGKILHGVIGGPPCQGFSRIGRRGPDDVRNNLFDHFFRLVAELRPQFYLLENVAGVLDAQFKDIREDALARLEGYHNLKPLVLKASNFGVATSRERIFFVGYLPKDVDAIGKTDFDPPANIELVAVETALRGLPRKISPKWQSEDQGWRRLTCRPHGTFWDKVFGEIPNGVGDSRAVRQLTEFSRVSGCLGTKHTAIVTDRFSALIEGAIDGPSRAVRLDRNGYCPTLRAGTGPDRGSFQALRPIHPTEPRVITPREAARLQGFPDWFIFDQTKWHSFRQIGNSVSPILAEAVLRAIAKNIRR